jgi:hypothetical protein
MPATFCFHHYLKSRAEEDGYEHVRVYCARGRTGIISVRLLVKHGSIDLVHIESMSEEQFYTHSEEWGMMYEEIKLQILFG